MLIPVEVLTVLAVFVLVPSVVLVAVPRLVAWNRRTRREAVRRQIAVTDAIHAALGAVVAPVVHRRLWGPWRLAIAVPFDRPDTVKRVIEVAYTAFDAPERTKAGRFELVLSPQDKPVPRRDRAAIAACRARGESVSWT